MKIYVVLGVDDYENGSTTIQKVFATRKAAEAYVKVNQEKWSAWWYDDELDALTIEEWEVEDEAREG